ncbi:hypothetical protein CcaverHIS002_0501260 [Cutaneotrichosporon cavernicola]|nr:hypothetical protein CcaverHIS002_0501260 [Cutaneotrichosporon cavernicola]
MYSAGLITAAFSVLALTDARPTPGGAFSAPIKLDKLHNRNLGVRSNGAYNLPIKHDGGGRVLNAHEARDIAAANTKHVRSRYEERAEEADVRLVNWRRDFMYSVDIELGTPPQTFTVHLDTGSASTYVMTKNCSIRACTTNNIPLLDFEASSTFEIWNTTARKTLSYGSGFASGDWANDTMAVGPFKVEKQAFLAVYNTDSSYVGTNSSGLLGLGFQGITGAKEVPWWQAAMDQWDDKRFGIYLERANLNEHPPSTHGNSSTGMLPTPGGMLTLGGVAEELYTGEVNYLPVTEKRYWMVDFDGAKVNGKAITLTGAKRAVFDTGSTLNYFPASYAKEFFAQIPGAVEAPEMGDGMWSVPCKTDTKVQFTFGGVDYDIFPDDFNFAIYNETEGTCLSQITGQSPFPIAEFLFGDAFMKSVYTIHRPEPAAIGLAQLVKQGTPYTGWPEYKGNSTTPAPTTGTNSSTGVETPTPSSNSSVSLPFTPVSSSSTTLTPSSSTTPVPSSSSSAQPSSSSSTTPSPSSSAEPLPSSSAEPLPSSSAEPLPSSSAEPLPSSSAEPLPSSSAEPPLSSSAAPSSSAVPEPSSSTTPVPPSSTPGPEPTTPSPSSSEDASATETTSSADDSSQISLPSASATATTTGSGPTPSTTEPRPDDSWFPLVPYWGEDGRLHWRRPGRKGGQFGWGSWGSWGWGSRGGKGRKNHHHD